MPTVNPLPIEISIPTIPPHFPAESKPTWTWVKPETWLHPEIPVEIEFPVHQPKKVSLTLKIEVPALGTFEVPLQLTALELAESPT